MKKYQYKCTLLTDVVITSMAATEGYKESLDYIPGSKFLGIAAGKLYNEQNEQKTLDIFHNGKVKFSDATLMLNDEPLLKVPFSWYHEKGESLLSKLYIHHLISGVEHENLREQKVQLKQARNGYFSLTQNKFITIDQDFSLKSAHDAENRKSKDGQMFGYFSLKKGSTWAFSVVDENGIYSDEIKSVIQGIHRIGRSRSAEYGLVEITFLREDTLSSENEFSGEIAIYAQSNLCFYNEQYGQSYALPTARQLVGTENATVLWDKCQVRSRSYKTWNRHRNNKDADRIIIVRGSVFVVKLSAGVNSVFFENGIGAHKNEGFGVVLVNPPFLLSENSQLSANLVKTKPDYKQIFAIDQGVNDIEILDSLYSRRKRNNFDYMIDQKVNAFIKEHGKAFKGISNSQWSNLRNYGKNLPDKQSFETMVFNPDAGFLFRGQSEYEWRKNDRRDILKKQLNSLADETEYLPFVVKLSNLMAKK